MLCGYMLSLEKIFKCKILGTKYFTMTYQDSVSFDSK